MKHKWHNINNMLDVQDKAFKFLDEKNSFVDAINQGSKLVGVIGGDINSAAAKKTATRVESLSDAALLGKNIINTARHAARAMPAIQAAHDLSLIHI